MKKLIKILCMALIICLMFSTITFGAVKKPAAPIITDVTGNIYSVQISFSPSDGATGYKLYMSEDEDFGYKSAGTVWKGKATVVDLQPSKTYYFKMRAYKTVNGKKYYSKYTKVVSCTTKYHNPSFYSNISQESGITSLAVSPYTNSFSVTVNLDSIYSYDNLNGKVLSKMNVSAYDNRAIGDRNISFIYGETGNIKVNPDYMLYMVLSPANGSFNAENHGVAYTATYNGKEYLFKTYKGEKTYSELKWTK